jgi:hypothetical protein
VKIFEISLHNYTGNLTLDGKKWFEEVHSGVTIRIAKS